MQVCVCVADLTTTPITVSGIRYVHSTTGAAHDVAATDYRVHCSGVSRRGRDLRGTIASRPSSCW